MTVYLDTNYHCHRTYKEGYVEAEHEFFDSIAPAAIECYKYIPERDFIQCFDSKTADIVERQYREDNEILSIITEGVTSSD